MNNRVLNQAALAFSILTIIAFAVAFSPAFLAMIFAFLAFLTAVIVFLVFIICGFISLAFSSGTLWEWVKAFCVNALNWAGELFTLVPEMARFCFADMAPICGGIGVGLGIIALVLSVVALSTCEKAENPLTKSEESVQTGKGKPKKKMSERTLGVVCVTLSSVFIALNAIGLVVVHIISYRLFL